MKLKFEVLFMEGARTFLYSINEKSRNKIIYNIEKAKSKNDQELFKKLKGEIWEFRTLYNKTYYRLLAFWDKTIDTQTLVISTHGIVKRSGKLPDKEIEKAESLRQQYFKLKKQ